MESNTTLATWKFRLTTGWSFMRVIRLALGGYMIADGILRMDVLAGGLGTLLLYQGIMNTGCCGSGGCSI